MYLYTNIPYSPVPLFSRLSPPFSFFYMLKKREKGKIRNHSLNTQSWLSTWAKVSSFIFTHLYFYKLFIVYNHIMKILFPPFFFHLGWLQQEVMRWCCLRVQSDLLRLNIVFSMLKNTLKCPWSKYTHYVHFNKGERGNSLSFFFNKHHKKKRERER